jgi:hypothetical protein
MKPPFNEARVMYPGEGFARQDGLNQEGVLSRAVNTDVKVAQMALSIM